MSGQHEIRHAYIIYIDRPESIQYADECARSCEEYGMPYTLWRGLNNPNPEDLESLTGVVWTSKTSEMGCTASHIKLWRTIAEQPHACCVFEHDAIVRHNFYNSVIPDYTLVMLGFRVEKRDDYIYPGGSTSFVPINKFEGTHAYAITPNMAKHLLSKLENEYTQRFGGVDTTIDGILSIHDNIGINRVVMDPPPVVCVVGNRVSTIQGTPAAYNASVTPGFLKGLTVPPLRIVT